MKMVTPANGVVVDVAESLVERYKERGYKAAKGEPERTPDEVREAPEPPRNRRKA